MKPVVMTDDAELDLEEIYVHIANDNPEVAEKLLLKLRQATRRLSHFPGIGSLRTEIASGLRSFTVDSYLVFYREKPDQVEILRYLHGAMDHARYFENK